MRGCPSSFCFPQRKGGLPSLPPADSAGAVSGGGGQGGGGRLPPLPFRTRRGLAFLLARLPCLSRCFCPHPPDPLPGGKGETKVIFMQGASPLASPGAEPARRLQPLPIRCQAGGVPFLSPANPVFSLLSCPHPPYPLPGGKGGILLYFAGGSAPGTPALNRLRLLQSCQTGTRRKGKPAACCKSDRRAFLWAVSAAKERGDRGRWNYPSQATAAFEMVLSPGAGRTGAAWGQYPRRTPAPQG